MSQHMRRALKLTLISLAILAGVVAAAGAGASVWVKHQQQKPEYCAGCHVIAPYHETWKSSDYTAHAHQKLGLVCQDCHTRDVKDGLREIARTLTHTYEVPLKDSPATPEKC